MIVLSVGNKVIEDKLLILNRELEVLNDEKKIKNNIYLKVKEKYNF